MLTIKKSFGHADNKGEYSQYTRYTPTLTGEKNPCFSGIITFASWEVWDSEDNSVHDSAQQKALDCARIVIRNLSEQIMNGKL